MTKNLTSGLLLPKNVKPVAYNIVLEPDLLNFTFDGKADIALKILEKTDTIVFHSKDLKIQSVFLVTNGKQLVPSDIQLDEENEKAILVFKELLELGEAKLIIIYQGVLNDKMAGFYRSTYEVNGEKRVMASTQLEDTSARMAFPCWDEPNIKARYRVTLTIPKNLKALSNTPVQNETLARGGSKKTITFEETPIMSTYLVAFSVGEFEYIDGEPQGGIPIRVYTTPGKKELGHFALNVAEYVLRRCAEYFDHPYMGTKLDLVAIPDFAAGAMENLGLITFRETAILIDEHNSSRMTKQEVAITVAHEIVHMWFGDLVTMDWWEELWLNEAFATIMSFLVVNELFPEWNVWNKFIVEEYSSALVNDALRTTHPIQMPIHGKNDIGQNFDSISYEKGGSVLRMLHGYLGANAFRDGLRLYIARHAYGNATTEDLWSALEDASHKPVRAMMDTWVKQSGYPLVQVQRDKDGELFLTQSRFLSSGEPLNKEEEKQTWHIATQYITEDGTNGNLELSKKESPIATRSINLWTKLNLEQFGFYRVNYTPELWEPLRNAVMEKAISPVDRMGISDDLYALTRAGVIPATRLLSFLDAYRNENEYIVWASIIQGLSELEILFEHEDRVTRIYHKFARQIVKNIAKHVGWDECEGESEDIKLLRPIALGAYGHYGNPETIARSREFFKKYCDRSFTVNPDLRNMVCRLAAKHGSEEDHDIVLNRYRHETHPEEKLRFLRTLGRFPHEHLILRTLQFGIGDEVRSQDMTSVIYSTAINDNPRAVEYTWAFIKENWRAIHGRLGTSIMLLERVLEGGAQSLKSHEDALDVEKFFERNPTPRISKTISQTLEIIRSRANWILRDREPATKWILEWQNK